MGHAPEPVGVFRKVLVANRGEIAVRIFRTLRELGIGCVAVYSEPDRNSLHVAFADEAYLIGPARPPRAISSRSESSTRLSAPAPRRSTPATGSSRRTPPSRARSRTAGLTWIGPPPEAIEAMGSKIAARERDGGGRRPDRPGHDRAARVRATRLVRARRRARLAARDQGVRRRRREGPEGRPRRRTRPQRAFESARREAEAYFSDADRVRRALPRGPAPRRGPGPRRRARQRHPPRRARLHDPAPPPEAHRGDALTGRGRRAPRSHRRGSPSTRPAPSATGRPGRSRVCSPARASTSSSR